VPGDLGSFDCASAQANIQNLVGDEPTGVRNHGTFMRQVAKLAGAAVASGQITNDCADCIVGQFAQRMPVAQQTDCGDRDGDGFTVSQGDCNDKDAAVHPGATETSDDSVDSDCNGLDDPLAVPNPNPMSICGTSRWLCFGKASGLAVADAYYATINAPDSFDDWKRQFGFPIDPRARNSGETVAFYYNEFDLRLGREMHCRRVDASSKVACYVTNHGCGFSESPACASLSSDTKAAGGAAGDPPEPSLENTVNQVQPIASVAMVYDPSNPGLFGGPAFGVQFYVYKGDGTRLNQVALDSEGAKNVPQLCTSCHGGIVKLERDSTTNQLNAKVQGAHFLPFDLDAFLYSEQKEFTRSAQEGAFGTLNSLVLSTSPNPGPIQELIEGWYAGPTGTFNGGFVPGDMGTPGDWAAEPQREMYERVVKPYSRGCHITDNQFPFATYAQFMSAHFTIQSFSCGNHGMPNAEVDLKRFWTDTTLIQGVRTPVSEFIAEFCAPDWMPFGMCCAGTATLISGSQPCCGTNGGCTGLCN